MHFTKKFCIEGPFLVLQRNIITTSGSYLKMTAAKKKRSWSQRLFSCSVATEPEQTNDSEEEQARLLLLASPVLFVTGKITGSKKRSRQADALGATAANRQDISTHE